MPVLMPVCTFLSLEYPLWGRVSNCLAPTLFAVALLFVVVVRTTFPLLGLTLPPNVAPPSPCPFNGFVIC